MAKLVDQLTDGQFFVVVALLKFDRIENTHQTEFEERLESSESSIDSVF